VPRRSPAPKPTRTPDEHAALIRRAEAGEGEAIGVLTDEHRSIDDFKIDPGDFAARVEQDLIVLASNTIDDQAAIIRFLGGMRTDLDGPAPSPIERLLIDDIVTCWLHLHFVRGRWTRALKDRSVTNLNVMEHLLNGAQRRYDDAHKTLAQVRRLIIPVVQLNVANQQVNVVGGSALGAIGSSS
jgi:hypothetical protein